MQGKLISRYLGVSTQVMELPGAELEGFQEALDILLKKDNVTQFPNYKKTWVFGVSLSKSCISMVLILSSKMKTLM